ncbi:MauE/DoxX family redox-associated membrane protein [Salidesulfovibrio onnuriiensis]|uniref:MauE/DoxX family redox-associated membrane protein n=1 Tax=Salidesulfovibrio onnuriiensis TaxID=2583823 RepID=UPI0011C95AAA|nr:MauE/DoxX family redox-associated membrane protein [Salidesulfovibrio onnuriiensis]
MKKMTFLLRFLLGAIFVYASWDKLMNPVGFAQAIGNYHILPDALIGPAALWLPWLELVVGLALMVGWFRHGAASVATGLMAIFTAAVAYSHARGLDINCGCFTTTPEATSDMRLVLTRDICLTVLCVLVLCRTLLEHKNGGPRQGD